MVATYHSSHDRSRALSASAAILRPSLEKISARIAVSEYSRGTQVSHVGGEPVVIPNGLYVDRFACAEPRPDWRGAEAHAWRSWGGSASPARASRCWPRRSACVAAERPGLRLLVVGGGDVDEARELLPGAVRDQVTFLGRASDEDKAAALRTADVYVAPNTGGESFGIVLVEAMAAGATVLASDIPAFRRVLDEGANGVLFANEDAGRPGARSWPRCSTTRHDGRPWTPPPGAPYAATTGRRWPGRSCGSTRPSPRGAGRDAPGGWCSRWPSSSWSGSG